MLVKATATDNDYSVLLKEECIEALWGEKWDDTVYFCRSVSGKVYRLEEETFIAVRSHWTANAYTI